MIRHAYYSITRTADVYRGYDFRPVKNNPQRRAIRIATVRKALFG